MDPPPEFVVRVKVWPTYLLAGLLPVLIAVYGAMVGLLLWVGLSSDSYGFMIFLGAVMIAGATTQLASMAHGARVSFQLIRHPPRLSATGIGCGCLPLEST